MFNSSRTFLVLSTFQQIDGLTIFCDVFCISKRFRAQSNLKQNETKKVASAFEQSCKDQLLALILTNVGESELGKRNCYDYCRSEMYFDTGESLVSLNNFIVKHYSVHLRKKFKWTEGSHFVYKRKLV